MDLRSYTNYVKRRSLYQQVLKEANKIGLTKPQDKLSFRIPYTDHRNSMARKFIEISLENAQYYIEKENKKLRAEIVEEESKLSRIEKKSRLLIKKNN